MTQHDQEREHEDLQRLFDETAGDAAGPTLTKLLARAADIPGQAARKSRFLPRWAWGPVFAGAAGTLAGLLALRGVPPKPAPARVADPTPAPAFSVAVASASSREVNGATARATAEEPSDGPELLGDADEGARFDVSGPEADRDLDAWLAATKDLSGGT
jgi:hypothetical protein